jgi:hypothetical protein
VVNGRKIEKPADVTARMTKTQIPPQCWETIGICFRYFFFHQSRGVKGKRKRKNVSQEKRREEKLAPKAV